MNRRARTRGPLLADVTGAFDFSVTIYSEGVLVGFRLLDTWRLS